MTEMDFSTSSAGRFVRPRGESSEEILQGEGKNTHLTREDTEGKET